MNSPFAWLESIAPPILVLSTAYVLKEQALESIERRHANERAFQAALTDWQVAVSDPEDHPQWLQFYANALRKTNNRCQETLTQMTQNDWHLAVTREMPADVWYTVSSSDEAIHLLHSSNENVFSSNRNGNGHYPKARVAVESGDV